MKKIQIIWQNDEILVINKECGVSVQGGSGIAHPLDEELSKQLGYKIYLVHRLDKETSGLMVAAKSAPAANKWINLIAGKQVKKEYTALCFGKPFVSGKECTKGTLKDSVVKGGRELSAVTQFEVIKSKEIEIPERLSENNPQSPASEESQNTRRITISLLHLTLGTGRMHQIRIHLAKALCPIIEDDKHGNFKLNKAARPLKIKKLCLASTKLTLPLEGKQMVFETELPEHMKNAVQLLT